MKLIHCFFLTALCLSVISVSYAEPMNKNMWTCKTNATSAKSGSPDALADDNMAKNPKGAKEAFAYALEHCRDCTKITCSKS